MTNVLTVIKFLEFKKYIGSHFYIITLMYYHAFYFVCKTFIGYSALT